MTQAQLDRAVANQTGEPRATIRRLGFQVDLLSRFDAEEDAADVRLVVDCPSCRRSVPYPGYARDGSPLLAECADPRCDLYFDFDPMRVYAEPESLLSNYA